MHEALEEVSKQFFMQLIINLEKFFYNRQRITPNNEQDPYASKDLSLLRYAVPDYINNNFSNNIIKIEESPLKLGGSGSIIVFLKK